MIDRNDPRLTAYALGEMNDDDRRAFEAELETDATLVAEIEGIRELGSLLSERLGQGAPRELDAEQRSAIEDAARNAEREDARLDAGVLSVTRRRRWWRTAALMGGGGAAALAASMLLFVGLVSRQSDQSVAELEPVPPTPTWVGDQPAPALVPEGTETEKAGDKRIAAGQLEAGAPLGHNTEAYDHIQDNPFVLVAQDPRSTFSIDVDTASYSLVRRHLSSGNRPPPGAVRIEEMINYFHYDYPEPATNVPFSVNTEVSTAPWAPQHQLVRIGIKGKHVGPARRPPASLVFLLDVSGSMNSPDKLPLLKRGFEMLVHQLDGSDRVSIVVYAGASGLVLPPTPGNQQRRILEALHRLEAGGSTNGGEGIQLAYAQAQRSFIPGGVNRVILATDGDFNVGTTNQSELVRLIEAKAKTNVFLSVLGFGSGNYDDSMLEKLADKGNGNYAYIDNAAEARKVLVEQASGTIVTIAKDVKIQLEMNPTQVEAFRLIGYENRMMAHQDFTDDKKDAGEIGADHTVTALYEIVPKGGEVPGGPRGSLLRYQQPSTPTEAARSNELLTVKLRYKEPTGSQSREVEFQVVGGARPFASASRDHQFAAAVASFGMLLRRSEHRGTSSYAQVLDIAKRTAGADPYRNEFITLVRHAQGLD